MKSKNLYNYFVKNNTRRFKVLLSILFLLLIAFPFFFLEKAFSDPNLYYYTFSAIVQGFLTLIAFLGALVVYKLQIMENDLNNIRDRMENDLVYFKSYEAYSFSWLEAKIETEKILSSHEIKKGSPHNKHLKRLEMNLEKIKKIINEREIRSRMIDFSFLSFINVGFSLIMIPISKVLVTNILFCLATFLLIISVAISFLSMVWALKIIKKALGYDFKL